tara:strand:+ start:697 stop:2070 length:1374 start_codon:yes stop_codon:yes gene_type:complete
MRRVMNSKLRILIFAILLLQVIYPQITDLSEEWETNMSFELADELENVVATQIATLPNTLGFIVIHKGKIVSENYYGSDLETSINIWSVTKSFISALVGQAVDMGMINDPDSTASNFFPDYGIGYLDTLTLHNILTMSSGYADQFYPTDPFTFFFDPSQWWALNSTEILLSMPYADPGEFYYNNSACHLNAHALFYGTDMTPSEFAGEYLFPYLGIDNPVWESGYLDINDGSAMLNLTLREMVKLGQLYLQDGYSGETQILSQEWIERSTQSHVETGIDDEYGDLSDYGYLWWLIDDVGSVYTAQGLGGQIIAVFPEYDLVIGAHSDVFGDDISDHSTVLNYRILEQIAPIFDDLASNKHHVTVPRKISLEQNYPNPFNSKTKIEYSLYAMTTVEITVYDIGGKLIKSLVSEVQSAGSKVISWNGTNKFGEFVPSGTYFYRIEAGLHSQTRKMIIIK